MVKIFFVQGRVDDIQRAERGEEPDFHFRVYEIIATETSKSYVYDNKRLSKEKLGIIVDTYGVHNHDVKIIGFEAYVFEQDIPSIKQQIHQMMIQKADKNVFHAIRMREMLGKQPREEFKPYE